MKIKFARAVLIISLVSLGAAAWPLATSFAATPTPTVSATSTPSVQLLPPGVVQVHTSFVVWSDQAVGEEGYRLDITIGEVNKRTFLVPADSTRFDLPADFRRSCEEGGLGPTMDVSIVAYRGSDTSAALEGEAGGICAPWTATPAVTTPRLPETGSADGAGASRQIVAWVLAVGGVAIVLVGLSLGYGRRLPG